MDEPRRRGIFGKEVVTLTGKDIKCCLFVIAGVSVEDVADHHAGLAYSAVAHQHAAQFLPQPGGLVRPQTGLCHLLDFFSFLSGYRPMIQARSSSSSTTVNKTCPLSSPSNRDQLGWGVNKGEIGHLDLKEQKRPITGDVTPAL